MVQQSSWIIDSESACGRRNLLVADRLRRQFLRLKQLLPCPSLSGSPARHDFGPSHEPDLTKSSARGNFELFFSTTQFTFSLILNAEISDTVRVKGEGLELEGEGYCLGSRKKGQRFRV